MNKYKIHLTVIFIFISLSLYSQNPPPYQDFSKDPRVYNRRNSFWFEGNFAGTLMKNDSGQIKWQYQFDNQYRRGSDADYIKNGNTANIVKDISQNVFRVWVHYFPLPGKLRLSVAPTSIVGNWSPKAEGPATYFTEYRTTLQLTLFSRIEKLDIQQRFRYELRFNGNNINSTGVFKDMLAESYFPSTGYKTRLRYMLRLSHPLNKKGNSYAVVFNELFIAFGKNTASNKILDQNRLVVMYGRKNKNPGYPVKTEVGFTWQLVPKFNMDVPPTQPDSYGSFMKSNLESNLALQIFLIVDETHKLRKLKKKP
jgi:hypothetical protein